MVEPAELDLKQSRHTRRQTSARLHIHRTTRTFDAALLLGLFVAFGLVASALYVGGSITSFYNTPALMIVLLGTFAVTMVSFSFKEMISASIETFSTIFPFAQSTRLACEKGLFLANFAREHGSLALEPLVDQLNHDSFLRRMVELVVDGSEPSQVDRILGREIISIRDRRDRTVSVLRRAAEVAPAMGLIGTLVGLIQLLGNLDNPSAIGPAMAIALLTTFYGAVIAYMILAPIAAKLDRNTADELLICEVYLACAVSIAKRENTRILETYLNTKLSPSERLNQRS